MKIADNLAPCLLPLRVAVFDRRAVEVRDGSKPLFLLLPTSPFSWVLISDAIGSAHELRADEAIGLVSSAVAALPDEQRARLLCYARARGVEEPEGRTHRADPANQRKAVCGMSPWKVDHGAVVPDDRRDDANPTCDGCRNYPARS